MEKGGERDGHGSSILLRTKTQDEKKKNGDDKGLIPTIQNRLWTRKFTCLGTNLKSQHKNEFKLGLVSIIKSSNFGV